MGITASSDDNLESIVEKIISVDEKTTLSVYGMFRVTHPNYTTEVNIVLKSFYPKVWKSIRKIYYPTFSDKIKKLFGS